MSRHSYEWVGSGAVVLARLHVYFSFSSGLWLMSHDLWLYKVMTHEAWHMTPDQRCTSHGAGKIRLVACFNSHARAHSLASHVHCTCIAPQRTANTRCNAATHCNVVHIRWQRWLHNQSQPMLLIKHRSCLFFPPLTCLPGYMEPTNCNNEKVLE